MNGDVQLSTKKMMLDTQKLMKLNVLCLVKAKSKKLPKTQDYQPNHV